MKNRNNPITAGMLSGLLALSMSVLTATGHAAQNYFGHGAPGAASELPEGKFRDALEALPDDNRQRAVQWLQSIEFTTSDLPHMRVDRQGGIYYADRFATGKSSSKSSRGVAAKTGISADRVMKLHSRPGASYTLFIDFDGGRIEKTAWNAVSGEATLEAAPYNSEGKPGRFSETELDEIVDIWQRVAEDFAPFEADVTTEDPGRRGPKIAWVMVTDSEAGRQELPEAEAGSVAYMNTLGSSITTYYTPALVYRNNHGSAASVAGAVSHATGHLAGLSHDVIPANRKASWRAIMGLDHDSGLTQWSKGNGQGATNPQDDLAILMGRLGLRNDDHDDSRYDSGTPLQVDASGRITGSGGIIEDRDDIDVFAFGAGAGTLDILVAPQSAADGHHGANLDIQVSLYDASGKRLLRQDARNDVAVRLKKQLPAGRYKLEVTGVGPDSGYGSLGQYVISGNVPAGGKRAALER
jgi:hypothetical protein